MCVRFVAPDPFWTAASPVAARTQIVHWSPFAAHGGLRTSRRPHRPLAETASPAPSRCTGHRGRFHTRSLLRGPASRGACGRVDCEGLTYADHSGHWQTFLRLTTARGRRDGMYASPTGRLRPRRRPSRASRCVRPRRRHRPPRARSPRPAADPPADARPARDSLAIGSAGPLVLDLADGRFASMRASVVRWPRA